MKTCSRPRTVLVLLGLVGLGVVYIIYKKESKSSLVWDRWILYKDQRREEEKRNTNPRSNLSRAQPPSCSLRWTVDRDVLLQKRFKFSVPVFQHRDSFSEESWSDLSLRDPPYGWRGLDQDVVWSALSLLVSSDLWDTPVGDTPVGDRCVRCAVVGNGGILRGSGQGRAIDSHHYVFRVNGAVLRGFEDDVGTKTSFYGFTTNTMKNSLRKYHRDGFHRVPQSPNMKYIFIPSNLRDYVMISSATRGRSVPSGPDRGDRPWDYFGRKPPEGFRFLHPDFVSYVTHSFLESPLLTNPRTRHLYMPSTGALLLLTALHTCDQVSAFGFMTQNYALFSDHYFDSVHKPLRFFANHDLRLEQRLWDVLHQRGVLTLYHRDQSDLDLRPDLRPET